MSFNPRIIQIDNEQQAREILARLGCDPAGIKIMAGKAVFKTVMLENVPSKAANLLKQTFLAKGAEVAVARGTADLSVETTDVVVCATLKQYRLALSQLKAQPWGLPKVAEELEMVLAASENFPVRHFSWTDRQLSLSPERTIIMGILNVTPDSFSDGGRYNNLDAALKQAEKMVRDGADIIDIGAESTRPYGATKISAEEEMERLLPILEKLVSTVPVPISVDTYKAVVAEEALKLGVHIINDVWGLQGDPRMAKVVAKYQVPVVVMHNKTEAVYERDIMAEICAFLRHSLEIGMAAGIHPGHFIVDPGIGFGKTPDQNLTVMARLDELRSLGCPILLGTSRKRFIGEVLNLPVDDRIEGTGATVALGIVKGVSIVRVHDVKQITRIARMSDAMVRRRG
ncbi:dihydropteroate synthase [Thermosinus carboxydivorans Nor1]|uniref:Dihydropteroate synthase n=1 Tax=Thermosinus carboxydivorans Nor1 TaxID=401526 RepID=A1HN56_9FIRM|nr:dihydropteroate synthase [Thermosinus carboxydivorans]EAX48683.1 dihydropteroate synthase [Thermosinus carboxydivorans Nor1]